MQTDLLAKARKHLEDEHNTLRGAPMNECVKKILDVLEYEHTGVIRYTYTDDEYGKAARKLHAQKGVLGRSYPGDAGVDLPTVLHPDEGDELQIWPGERVILHTGVIMEFPVGYWGRIIHRSSTERRSRLRVIEGVIDDYRGEILIQVHNGNSCHASVGHGHKLAQLIIHKTASFECEPADELRPSVRGARGFGSSGA